MTYFKNHFDLPSRSPLRQHITEHHFQDEETLLKTLLPLAELSEEESRNANSMARAIAHHLRDHKELGILESLVQEYSLSSEEGIALMSLAEALLRTPDAPTQEDLIADKLSLGDWLSHCVAGQKHLINASAWGLHFTQKITQRAQRLSNIHALLQLYGEPLIRHILNKVIKRMGHQFVLGETIQQGLKNSQERMKKGFTYSYDMLGEAALCQEDAERYLASYHTALEMIGQDAKRENKDSLYERSGISVKLSALHPCYHSQKRDRVLKELYPLLKSLAVRARHYNISLTIDAEESARLELSLDLLEMLCHDPDLKEWHGLGFVVQAYNKRASFVIDYLRDLAKNTAHRLMIRLVKGAYWDSEIKRAQSDSLKNFPVFTRKAHTDISYLACARKLFEASGDLFPQFATHNARTVATIYHMAKTYFPDGFKIGDYEFQGLHGMGEPLYDHIIGITYYNRPCRLYAPIGTYKTLLAYLVRRLLENGANSSFVHLLGDKEVSIDQLIEDPIAQARHYNPLGSSHPLIKKPDSLFGENRLNSKGFDIHDEKELQILSEDLEKIPAYFKAFPLIAHYAADGTAHKIFNPADKNDLLGEVLFSTKDALQKAIKVSEENLGKWASLPPLERARILKKASDLIEEKRALFSALLIREAGKTLPNAINEIRETIDFLRYYAQEISDFNNETHRPLGSVICISPWNFPLAIFIGQIAASLAAGNHVLAKPAEETPLIAFEAVKLLHEAGVPPYALSYLPGRGDIGAALVAQKEISGVMFTGSNEVAQQIAKQLLGRLGRNGQPLPFIAETGGQNAMIVDSTALPEQAVHDILTSAFDSAGQRCSSLRLLCIQDDLYPHIMPLLRGAMKSLSLGNPAALKNDIGPVISQEAQQHILAYIEQLRAKKHKIFSPNLSEMGMSEKEVQSGHFIAPTLIEIHSLDDLSHEVFGPVLHILRYPRRGLKALIQDINKTGYGLSFGVHTRLTSHIDLMSNMIEAGNIYVNRNMIGAVVGMQPFGGHALSGTGPKAGGPFAVRRLLSQAPLSPLARKDIALPNMARSWLLWLGVDDQEIVQDVTAWIEHGLLHLEQNMPSPVGETNLYRLLPRGQVLLIPETERGLKRMISYALSCDNRIYVLCSDEIWAHLETMSDILKNAIKRVNTKEDIRASSLILAEKPHDMIWEMMRDLLQTENQPLPILFFADPEKLRPEMLLNEQVISTNSAALGGNIDLMACI